MIVSEIFRALGYLFIASIVYYAWKSSKDAAQKEKPLKVLLKGLGYCFLIAFLSNIYLGSHTEECEDDPIRGMCDRIEDFEPTTEERIADFGYIMTLLYIPVVIGACSKNKGNLE